MDTRKRLAWALCILRLSVFLVMLMWTLDKFLRPEHAAGVYVHFYSVSGLGASTFYVLGAMELLLLIAFVTGYAQRLAYGAVLALHAASTLSSWQQYLHPYEDINLLFFGSPNDSER